MGGRALIDVARRAAAEIAIVVVVWGAVLSGGRVAAEVSIPASAEIATGLEGARGMPRGVGETTWRLGAACVYLRASSGGGRA